MVKARRGPGRPEICGAGSRLRVVGGSIDAARPADGPVPAPGSQVARFSISGYRMEMRMWPEGTVDPGEPSAVKNAAGVWWHIRVL